MCIEPVCSYSLSALNLYNKLTLYWPVRKMEGLYNSKCVGWLIQNHSDDGSYDVSHYDRFTLDHAFAK